MADVQYEFSFLEGTEPSKANEAKLARNGDRASYGINGTSFDDYTVAANILEAPFGLQVVVAEAMRGHDENVGLDIAAGSDADALVDLLDDGLLTTGIATNYADERSPKVANDTRLKHISGSLLEDTTWRELLETVEDEAPDGLALVMHRPLGELQYLPPNTYRGAAHFLLDLIRPGGVMYAQVPAQLEINPRDMVDICTDIRARADVVDVLNGSRFYHVTELQHAVILK